MSFTTETNHQFIRNLVSDWVGPGHQMLIIIITFGVLGLPNQRQDLCSTNQVQSNFDLAYAPFHPLDVHSHIIFLHTDVQTNVSP